MKKIDLKVSEIEKVSDSEYIVYGKTEFIKISDNFVDYEGGPSFVVGGLIPTTSLKISKIDRMGNKGNMPCFKLTVWSEGQEIKCTT